MTRITLSPGPDRVVLKGGENVIVAPSGTLNPNDTIAAAPASTTVLVLQDGNSFNLAAPAVLAGIGEVIDHSVGDTTITLRQGLDLTLHLGVSNASVVGANNADTIVGGNQGFDIVDLGSRHEHVVAGSAGVQVNMTANDAGAAILGKDVTDIGLTGQVGQVADLGGEIEGVGQLAIDSPGLTVGLAGAGIAAVLLEASNTTLIAGPTTGAVQDLAGGNRIEFTGPGQTLLLPETSLLPGLAADTVTGFGAGDAIELDLPYGATSLAYDAQTGVAVLTDGRNGVSTSVQLPAGLAGLALSPGALLPNGDSGLQLALGSAEPPSGPPVPCFAAGTRIATPDGPVAAELLRPGDRVLTLSGAGRRIAWVGHRHVRPERLPLPLAAAPVLIAAHAVADNVPSRDLLLSPDHALYLDGVLVPVRALANGATVRHLRRDLVNYIHLELATHDVVWAEGMAVETYFDSGNRHGFTRQFGQAPRRRGRPFAPVRDQGPAVARIRRRLADRARRAGWRVGTEPALTLVADRQVLPPEREGALVRYRLPQAPRSVLVQSRVAPPAGFSANPDCRPLGVALRGVSVAGPDGGRRLPALSPVWGRGVYPPECDGLGAFRWTDGVACLPSALWTGLGAPLTLELHLAFAHRYPLAPSAGG